MINLEELSLYLIIDRDRAHTSFIDGNDLKKDIINHMPKLNKFVFSIDQNLFLDNSNNLPSNQDIQCTLKSLEGYHIVSCVDYFPSEKIAHCHMYTYPCEMRYYYRLTNSFPGGLFKFVNEVVLFDERPFAFEFFLLIAQAFPFLQRLNIENQSAQKCKRSKKSKFVDGHSSMIKFPHMTYLNLSMAHIDYVEQFLDHKKTCLSNYIKLFVDYHCLQRVTHNFTRDTIRVNCAKVKILFFCGKSNIPTHFNTYFPDIEIIK